MIERPRLRLQGVSKSFSGVVALAGVDLTLGPGAVLALVGENGAGKSTLLNVISGSIVPDRGDVEFDGAAVSQLSTKRALQLGIAMVHQELTLFPELTIAQNVLIGHEPRTRSRTIARRAARTRTIGLLRLVGLDASPDQRVSELSVGQQIQVEIAKAVAWEPRLLILDEATSALGEREVETVFRLIREVAARGTSVVFVSHRLGEIVRIATSALVLRDGRAIRYFDSLEGVTESTLVESMIGRPLDRIFPDKRRTADPSTVLEVENLSGGALQPVSFALHRGEIVGLAGLQGSGQEELLELLFGARPRRSGTVKVDGDVVKRGSPNRVRRMGVGYVPADRKQAGLILDESVEYNASLSALDLLQLARTGLMSGRRERDWIDGVREHANVIQRRWRQPVRTLSGGNQQKVLLGRWIERRPRVLLLDEATRGVDVATKVEIYGLLRRLADAGTALLFSSTEGNELLGLCDRILVLYDGAIGSELSGRDVTDRNLTAAIMGTQLRRTDTSPKNDGGR